MQSEMKMFEGFNTLALKQHFGKKIMELEEEKRAVQVNYCFIHLMLSLIILCFPPLKMH